MKKILFYSHDTYGLGNIRRTLSMCQSLIETIPDVSILVVSGSPMVHSFRIPAGIDYVKLPCLTRTERDGYSAKFLDDDVEVLAKLRSDIILCTVANFKPDLVMVDKKPFGVQNELKSTLAYLHEYLPKTKVTLILRDILDSPEKTQEVWARQGYGAAIEKYYDEISVLGSPEVFDPREEYAFTPTMKALTRFWGYIRREPGRKSRVLVRQELGISQEEPFVLVTAGGGEDGIHIFENYLQGYAEAPATQRRATLMIFGPDMAAEARGRLEHWAAEFPRIHTLEFTDDLMSYMDAADVVVAMGGYGTACEILTLNKLAIVIPRVQPVQEQWIRAQRMGELGVFQVMHPEYLTGTALLQSVNAQVKKPQPAESASPINLNALPRISENIKCLLREDKVTTRALSTVTETVLSVGSHSEFAGLKGSKMEQGYC